MEEAQEKGEEIPRAGGGMSEEQVEDQVYASGSGLAGICQSLSEQDLRHTGHYRCQPKKSLKQQRGGSRKGIQMALVEEGRAVGAVECHLNRPGSDQPRSGRLEGDVCCKTRNNR